MIRAYTGLLGYGKTLSMVNDAMMQIKNGVKVFTNTPFTGAEFLPKKHFEQAILNTTNAVFCIDEAAIVFPNYFWNHLPVDFLLRFAQSRKYGLHIFYTTQRLNHTVKRLRDLTNIVVKCRKVQVFGHWDFFENTYYDPEYFDFKIMTDTEVEKKFILGKKWILPPQVARIYRAYDTFYTVDHNLDMAKEK